MLDINQINYFDIHSHLDDKSFDIDRLAIIEKMKKEKIYTVTIGIDKKTSSRASEISISSYNIYASIGLHPNYTEVEEFDPVFYQQLLNTNSKIVCIGECGLDYFYLINKKEEEIKFIKEKQINNFKKQIDFACKNNLPLMLHLRSGDALDDAYEILKEKKNEYGEKLKANLHFFLSSKKRAKKFLDLGFSISLPGPITYSDLSSLIKFLPLDKIMSETDSPYAAPSLFRGQRNSPIYIGEIVEKIANIKNLSVSEVQKTLNQNALKFFNL